MRLQAGIDLHTSHRRPSNLVVCRLANGGLLEIHCKCEARQLEDLVYFLDEHRPSTIAIDAPLSPPPKRGFRQAELRALKDGARLLPPSLPPMRRLAEQGVLLAGLLGSLRWGPRIVETHPTSAALVTGLHGLDDLVNRIALDSPQIMSRHEKEALAACWVAALAEAGGTVSYGGSPEFLLPRPGYVVPAPQEHPRV